MIKRCTTNPNARDYALYGARGVRVCERWRVFENFLADMGPKPTPQHSLDRYPNRNGNYELGNCRWATNDEQAQNRRSTKLTTEQADAIRCDPRRQIDIAADYGVSQVMISAIKRRITWR
jgi:hypothetical protein